MLVKIRDKEYKLGVYKSPSNGVFEISLFFNDELASKISFGCEIVDNKKRVWLYSIGTSDNYKKFGLGSKLMQTMEYVALKNNVTHIDGYFYPDDETVASIFYVKNGYKFNYENGSYFLYKDLKDSVKSNEVITALQKEKNNEMTLDL